MLADFQEDFRRLCPQRTADEAGGMWETWTEREAFRGGVTDGAVSPLAVGGAAQARLTAVLIHEPGVTLRLHDRVRRVRDGTVFTVLGDSGDGRTPAAASLAYVCVPVERAVTAQ